MVISEQDTEVASKVTERWASLSFRIFDDYIPESERLLCRDNHIF